jgi:antitoxin VapB
MGKEYPARSFKSGNSVAIRMPAALGIEPDGEWTVEQIDGKLVLTSKPKPCAKINVDAFWGKAPGARLVPHGDFDERPSTIAARKAAEPA